MKILVVDDDDKGRKLLRSIFEAHDCRVIEAENGEKGLEMASMHKPDLIVSDAMMPVMDGFQFLRNLKGSESLKSIPFVICSGAFTGHDEAELALSQGAEAYILKPVAPEKLWKEISEIFEGSVRKQKKRITTELHGDEKDFLRKYSSIVYSKLEEKVKELESQIVERKKTEEELRESEMSYKEISKSLGATLNEVKKREQATIRSRDAFLNMLDDVSESYKDLQELFTKLVGVMVNALDAKSPWTKGHSMRVAMYAEEIAKEIGLDEDEIKNIRLAGLLHDIGKIGTYDTILDKPAKLTDEEFEIVKKHPAMGVEILRDIKQLKDLLPIIRHHHERMDGKGYPDGLKGEEIPFCARIMHVADTFDAIMADRPYRPSPGKEYAISELNRCNGTQFDSKVIEAFLNILS